MGLNCLCAIRIHVVGSGIRAKTLCVTTVRAVYDRLSLADAEAGENFAEQIIAGHRAGDFTQRVLALPEVFRQQFSSALVNQLLHASLYSQARASSITAARHLRK